MKPKKKAKMKEPFIIEFTVIEIEEKDLTLEQRMAEKGFNEIIEKGIRNAMKGHEIRSKASKAD